MRKYKNIKTPCQFLASYKYVEPYLRGRKTLDVGCATGEYLQTFSKESVGVDISIPNLEICRSKGLNVILADINKTLPFGDETFEGVFCSHVLEHVESPINFLQEMNRILKYNGIIVVGVPIEMSLARVFNDHYFNDHAGHIYAFSLANMKRLFEYSGFKVEKTVIDINWVWKLHLWWLLSLVQKLPYIFTMWWANSYWVIGKKVEVGG